MRLGESSIITLSNEQASVVSAIEASESHVYVTGKAGTGKSTVLNHLRHQSLRRSVVVAPTGIAALNIGGQTIHSLFGIAPGLIRPGQCVINRRTAAVLRSIDRVIIDEASMIRADLMDAIDEILRKSRRSSAPFGGVQVVMFGDLFQLPPVVERPLIPYFSETYGGYYFFDAMVWQSTALDVLELETIFRQHDDYFKSILNGIRCGEPSEEMMEDLNSRATMEIPKDRIITLTTVNARANHVNEERMSWLSGGVYRFGADVRGELDASAFPTSPELLLKEGAQVMMLRNDRDKRWVNGTIGSISSLTPDTIEVDIAGNRVEVKKERWDKIRYGVDESGQLTEGGVASFTQYPLRLAWAVTIHKSQGLTYDQVCIDLGAGAFSHGQTYVALSRCRTLEGVFLTRKIQPTDVIIDDRIRRFH